MTALMNDVPEVNGWFNIIDLSGVANGEMKVKYKWNKPSWELFKKETFLFSCRFISSQMKTLTNFENKQPSI